VVLTTMAKAEKTGASEHCRRDWAGDLATFVLVWGIPTATMLAALLLEPMLRAAVWAIMLTWMGSACIVNARRCSRTHCYYTGPFFLFMAVIVLAYAGGVAPLGSHGWIIIGLTTIAGTGIIWWASEHLLGTFRRRNW
jgi:hypothetical protein